MTPHAGARILVVDDEPSIAQALCDTLGHSGYRMQACADPQAALVLLQEQPFELLLTDLHMPGLDGVELLRRALVIDATLAVVIMTGAGTIATAVSAMQSGAADYILKPFKLNAALPVLARALEIRSLRVHNKALQLQLQDQLSRLAAANRDLESFASSVSHDLRAPLRAIDGFAAVLEESHAAGLDERGLHYLRRMRVNAQRMEELIEGLLRLAQIARQPLYRERVPLGGLAQQVVHDLQDSRLADGVQLVVSALPEVAGDRVLLRQVLFNLVSNACKFSAGRDGARVAIGCEDGGGDSPVIHVRDNGVGFDPEYASQLFQPFRRLHPAGKFPGLGLGLSIVERIVQKHGGRVWAESSPGQGACFRFTLEGGPAPPD